MQIVSGDIARDITGEIVYLKAYKQMVGEVNIKETVGKYDGSCVIKHDDDNFKVAILIHNQEK